MEAGKGEDVLSAALIDGRSLLDGVTDDERTSSALGIERVTGRTVDKTDVVGGGGVKLVPWSVDRSGVEYTSLDEISSTLEGVEVGLLKLELGSIGVLLRAREETLSLLRYGVE